MLALWGTGPRIPPFHRGGAATVRALDLARVPRAHEDRQLCRNSAADSHLEGVGRRRCSPSRRSRCDGLSPSGADHGAWPSGSSPSRRIRVRVEGERLLARFEKVDVDLDAMSGDKETAEDKEIAEQEALLKSLKNK